MELSRRYVSQLRDMSSDMTSLDGDIRRVSLVGAWLDKSGGLIERDEKRLLLTMGFMCAVSRAVHPAFKIQVIDMNYNQDFLRWPKTSDLVVLSYVANIPYSEAYEGNDYKNQSRLNTSRNVWGQACYQSGAQMVSTFHRANNYEVTPCDFDDDQFAMVGTYEAFDDSYCSLLERRFLSWPF